MSGITFVGSAARHGYTQEDAVQAMLHPVHGPLERPSRTSQTTVMLWVGPPVRPDSLVPLIEVLADRRGQTLVIFHVMAVQQQTLDLFTVTPD